MLIGTDVMSETPRRIPAFVNAAAGSGEAVLPLLRGDARFRVLEAAPEGLAEAIAAAVAEGAERVLVAGGDGTVAGAAAAVAGRDAALAVVPAGTLNHFAGDHGIPTDAAEALEVAVSGRPVPVDVGFANDRLFLNTLAVGAYVVFVRRRERLERWFGYYGASALAAADALVRLPSYSVEVEVAGEVKRYRTPLVFVGVDERELRAPKLGKRKEDGQRGLHVLIVRRTGRARLLAMALRTMVKGVRPWAGPAELESLLVQRCTVALPRRRARVAVDGELVYMDTPLELRLEPDALSLIVPEPPPEPGE